MWNIIEGRLDFFRVTKRSYIEYLYLKKKCNCKKQIINLKKQAFIKIRKNVENVFKMHQKSRKDMKKLIKGMEFI